MSNVTPDMVAAREETFGPVAAVLTVRDAEEAISVANASPYGLGASDPHLPFGSVKQSGYGRKLSEFGIREFTNVQSVWIGPPAVPQVPAE